MDIAAEKAKVDLEFKKNNLWREYIISPCGKYCYLIVPKNGSNTYRMALRRHDWRSHRFDPGAEHYLAHMSDPVERWIKGFYQFCLNTHIDVEEALKDKKLIPGIFDNHTMPISHIWCDYYPKIKFFRLGGTGMEDFIRKDYDIQNLQIKHVADQEKLNGYNLIRHTIKPRMQILSSFLYHDLLKFNDLDS